MSHFAACDGRGSESSDLRDSDRFHYVIVASCSNSCNGGPAIREWWEQSEGMTAYV